MGAAAPSALLPVAHGQQCEGQLLGERFENKTLRNRGSFQHQIGWGWGGEQFGTVPRGGISSGGLNARHVLPGPGAAAHLTRAELGVDMSWFLRSEGPWLLLINIQSRLYRLRAPYQSLVPVSPTWPQGPRA